MAKAATNTTRAKTTKKPTKSAKVIKEDSSSDEMPKTASKSKAKTRDSGKKKAKGAKEHIISEELYTDILQIPTLLSEASLPTCSSPTTTVIRFARRTLASASVRIVQLTRDYNTNEHIGQVGKVLGDKWKALSEKQREPYEKKAAADKKRYEDEKAKYNVSSDLNNSKSH